MEAQNARVEDVRASRNVGATWARIRCGTARIGSAGRDGAGGELFRTRPAPLPTSRKSESLVSVYGRGRCSRDSMILSFPHAVYVAYAVRETDVESAVSADRNQVASLGRQQGDRHCLCACSDAFQHTPRMAVAERVQRSASALWQSVVSAKLCWDASRHKSVISSGSVTAR